MSIQRIEGSGLTISLTNSAVGQYRRVKLTSTGYSVCGLTDYGDAITEVAADASATGVPARSVNAEGQQFGIADGAIAVGETLYSAASGAVSKTQGTNAVVVGRAVTAAADGAVVLYNSRAVA